LSPPPCDGMMLMLVCIESAPLAGEGFSDLIRDCPFYTQAHKSKRIYSRCTPLYDDFLFEEKHREMSCANIRLAWCLKRIRRVLHCYGVATISRHRRDIRSLLLKSPATIGQFSEEELTFHRTYEVATIRRLLKIIGLFCRISSLS